MKSSLRKALSAAVPLLLASASLAYADVKLPNVFSNHMVLQRDIPVKIWGTAAPGEKVTVSFAGQSQSATADQEGKWSLKLDPLKTGEPQKLTVAGQNTLVFDDVLVGEVWVGSGQSNMAGNVQSYAQGDEPLAKLAAQDYPQLRLLRANGGTWNVAGPATSGGFSALLFAFGQKLQAELKVPVGLIVGAVGGTPSGRWLTQEMLDADPAVQAAIRTAAAAQDLDAELAQYEKDLVKWQAEADAAKKDGKTAPRQPVKPVKAGEVRGATAGDLYKANILPVVGYGIRGVLWDQGESGTALQGVDQFTTMGALIKGWRTAWDAGEFPFLYVQKMSGGGCAWDPDDPVTKNAEPFTELPANPPASSDGLYREHHIRIMQHPRTAMVQARDLGSGVHPASKSGYGQRAARVALGFAYGKNIEYYGPLYGSHKIEGDKARITFTHVSQGLAFQHGDKLQGFQIAGEDKVFRWADAEISGDAVIVSNPEVAKPVAVRYAWGGRTPWANLFNKDGLPAISFRTDSW